MKGATQYTTRDGLGDNNGYALACDRKGRVWVGHLNHGVSVFNGKRWRNYGAVGGFSGPGTLSGPLGERVFAIKVCPTDGDVWIATDCGLSRYSESKDTWAYFTRGGSDERGQADAMPSDQAQALAFDRDGDLYLGTQCDGILKAASKENYAVWRTVARGPDDEPVTPTGNGLPSNMINDLVVAGDGTVWCATGSGLAWSEDHGQSWQYVRGLNYATKARQRVSPPPADVGQRSRAGRTSSQRRSAWRRIMSAPAPGDAGNIWIGFRRAKVTPAVISTRFRGWA